VKRRNVKIDHTEIGWEGVDWSHLDFVVNQRLFFFEYGNEISSFVKGGEFWIR
jgi:hypothetical protein